MPSVKDYSPFVPFDLYDFFGYLFPGIIFATCIYIFQMQFPKYLPVQLQPISETLKDPTLLEGITAIVIGIVFLYVIGHFVATLSHIIIDRVLIDGIEGYPINLLLDIPKKERAYSESTFKYLFALYNLILLAPVIISNYEILHSILVALLLCVAFLIVQRVVIMVVRFTDKGKILAKRVGDKKIFLTFLLPSKFIIDPIIGFLRRLLGLDRFFPKEFIALFKRLFKTRYGINSDLVGSENYWLSNLHACASNPVHQRTLQTWLHLYGFSRNACAAFYLAASLIIGHLLFNPEMHNIFTRVELGMLWVFAANLGIRYWILYSHYYTKGVIRAFVESVSQQSKTATSTQSD